MDKKLYFSNLFLPILNIGIPCFYDKIFQRKKIKKDEF